jgi:hypothetical protein
MNFVGAAGRRSNARNGLKHDAFIQKARVIVNAHREQARSYNVRLEMHRPVLQQVISRETYLLRGAAVNSTQEKGETRRPPLENFVRARRF